jgi:hypothetical protein
MMKQRLTLYLLALIIFTLCPAWGFFGHKRINRVAVFTLPKGMAPFYQANIDYITQHAVDPDKRRYVDSLEAPRHFFDADHYGKKAMDRFPERWAEADRQYSVDTLDKYGTVPWCIQHYYYKLVQSFKDNDTLGILKASANLGHYIADAHVPLHLTENYDGQLTNQLGIHSLWETRIPELFSDKYRYNVGKVHYIEKPLHHAWGICRHTYRCVDSVLRFERELSNTFPPDKKFGIVRRNGKNMQAFSVAYAAAYNKMLHGMVERQMRASILETGSYWFSAWVDAGQPNLNKLTDHKLAATVRQQVDKEQLLYQRSKKSSRKSKN